MSGLANLRTWCLGLSLSLSLSGDMWGQRGASIPFGVNTGQQGTSYHWTPTRWERVSRFPADQNLGEAPDAEILNHLIVNWKPPKIDTLGNILTIEGELLLQEGDQQSSVDWRQGVTVYLAKHPDVSLDWSDGMSQNSAASATCLATLSGSFVVSFDFRDDEIAVGRLGGDFQFGIALAKREARGGGFRVIEWNSDQAAVDSSIDMLEIPASPSISDVQRLINEARDWPFSDPDSVKLIRAVNALQALGKERALNSLEEYVELSREADAFDNVDIVFWIVRILFEPIELGQSFPAPINYVLLDDRDLPDEHKWPLNPLAVVDDVPLMIGHRIGGSGIPEQPASHIDYARAHCVIRDEPLRPTSDPITIADSLIKSRRLQALEPFSKDSAVRLIRDQALAMVSGIGGLVAEDRSGPGDDSRSAFWNDKVRLADQLVIEWDNNKQEFAVRNE